MMRVEMMLILLYLMWFVPTRGSGSAKSEMVTHQTTKEQANNLNIVDIPTIAAGVCGVGFFIPLIILLCVHLRPKRPSRNHSVERNDGKTNYPDTDSHAESDDTDTDSDVCYFHFSGTDYQQMNPTTPSDRHQEADVTDNTYTELPQTVSH